MLSIYFGSPGAGKSTYACYLAKRSLKKKIPVYSNFPIKGCTLFDSADIGKYNFSHSLVIIDEASIDFNNRLYKTLSKPAIQWFKLHRHYHCDVVVFSQSYDDMDITLRRLADSIYFIRRGLLKWFTHSRLIYKKIDIDELTHQIIDSYSFKPLSFRIIFNPPLWKMFDSWIAPPLPDFPSSSYCLDCPAEKGGEERSGRVAIPS